MKLIIPFFAALLLFCGTLSAQKASDVLENGVKIKSDNALFLKFDGTNLLYMQHDAPVDLRFKVLKDSIIFLPVENSTLVYLRPLNPLKYSYKAETKLIIDPIDEEAAKALNSIVESLETVQKEAGEPKFVTTTTKNKKGKTETKTEKVEPLCDFAAPIKMFEEINKQLKSDQKERIAGLFQNLQDISFDTKDNTEVELAKVKIGVDEVKGNFTMLEQAITAFKKAVDEISCGNDKNYEFVVKQVFLRSVADLDQIFQTQKKRYDNLQKVYDLVEKYKNEVARLNWLVKVDEVGVTKGKITLFTVKINETGYRLSDAKEIVAAETKEKQSRLLRFRRFNRFVPEVSAGFAYTGLTYQKYSTTEDANGKQVVADAGQESIKRLNFTTMLNYNLFITHSDLHPFWQIGLGLNTGIPTLLTGIGVRVNTAPAKRLALAVGIASTWVKTLDKLKLGDIIAGQADLEKDLKYQFNEKPKLYFGIQYNF